jgi:hypothetical protein
MEKFNIHSDIRKFWEDQGYGVKTSDMIHFDVDGGNPDDWSNQLFYAWTDETHYFLIADINSKKSYYFFEWSRYSEEEMLKLIKSRQ